MDRRSPGLLEAMRMDAFRLHDTWMELLFPRQLDPSSVLGKWRPDTLVQKIGYYLWGALGAPLVALGYPLLLIGFATRYQVARLSSAVSRVGLLGAVAIVALGWGGLTAITRVQLSQTAFSTVGGASIVATVSVVLAVLFSRVRGTLTSIFLAYPFGLTALFLPPLVAALSYPPLESIILPPSYDLAVVILDNVLYVGGIESVLRENFSLTEFGAAFGFRGLGYVLMWLGISFTLGWFLGILVSLANVIRPKA